jgi:hypothetical protein
VHVILTGNRRFIIRPVIFVKIEEHLPTPMTLADLHGVVLAKDTEASLLLVRFDHQAGRAQVVFDGTTTLFDTDMQLTRLDAVEVGDRIFLRGRLHSSGRVLADVVFRGDPLRLRGSLPDGADSEIFPFMPDPGEALEGEVDALLVPGARAYVEHGREVPLGLQPEDTRARLTGRYFLGEDLFRVGLVDLEQERLRGEIESVDLTADPPEIGVRTPDDQIHTVLLVPETVVCLVGDGLVPPEFLAVGQGVMVVFSGRQDGNPVAQTIRVEPQRWKGNVLSLNTALREILIAPEGGGSNLTLKVREEAAILLVSDEGATTIEFGDIPVSSEIEALGLTDPHGTLMVWVLLVNE